MVLMPFNMSPSGRHEIERRAIRQVVSAPPHAPISASSAARRSSSARSAAMQALMAAKEYELALNSYPARASATAVRIAVSMPRSARRVCAWSVMLPLPYRRYRKWGDFLSPMQWGDFLPPETRHLWGD